MDFVVLANRIVERLPRGRARLATQLQRTAASIPLLDLAAALEPVTQHIAERAEPVGLRVVGAVEFGGALAASSTVSAESAR